MALLKVFLCQVALLGLYKLFLEQVFEDYLVPDELTRNCLVGLVCLLCFGIQLYTDKPGDEENAEADENSKEKHKSKGTKIIKMSEPRETVGSKAASIVTTTKSQTTSQETGAEVKLPPNSKQVFESTRNSAVSPKEAEKVADATYSGIFAQFTPNVSDSIPKVIKVNGMKDSEIATSTAKTTNDKQWTIPVLNGISETTIYDESDEDGIEIDEFITKKSVKEVEQKEIVKNVEVEVVDAGEVTEETKQSRTVELEEVEEIKPKELTEVLESECLSANGYCFSSTKDMDTANLESDESPEMVAKNGVVKESSNNGSISWNIIEETKSKNLEQDESESREEMTLPSEPCEPMKDVAKPVVSAQEMSNKSATFGQTGNVDVITKSNVETSTLTKVEVKSSSEKLHESTARQHVTSTADICVAPVTIDISFIYACH